MLRLPLLACAVAATLASSVVAQSPVVDRWAVLIGVDDYANANDLQFCGADQAALREQLITSGFRADNVILLHDQAAENKYRPLQRNIEQQLRLVINSAEANDLLVVGFSGHGVSIDGKSYLCPSDATLSDPTTLVALDDVYEQLRNCAARFKWVLVDACRNDPTLGGGRSFTATDGTKQLARSLQELTLPEGVVLLNSCAPGEISWEEQTFGHGVFMHYVLEAMSGAGDDDGDGSVSLNELQRYAAGRTKSYVIRRFNQTQRPFYRSEGEAAAMDFALLSVRPATPPPTSNIPAHLLQGDYPLAEALEGVRGLEPADRVSLGQQLATLFYKAGDAEEGRRLIAELLAPARNDSSQFLLMTLAEAQAKAGDVPAAEKVFDEAKAAARKSVIAGFLLGSIAQSQVRAGLEAAGRATYEEARQQPNFNTWQFFFGDLAAHQARQGDIELASETLAKIGDESSSAANTAVGDIAAALAKEDRVEEAISIVGGLKDDFGRDYAYAKIVKAAAARGDLVGAQKLVDRITDDDQKQMALLALGTAQLQQDDVSGALATARSISTAYMRLGLLAAVGAVQSKTDAAAGDRLLSEVVDALNSSADEAPSFAWSIVVGALAKHDRLPQAYEIAFAAKSPKVQVMALIAVAQGLHEKRHPADDDFLP